VPRNTSAHALDALSTMADWSMSPIICPLARPAQDPWLRVGVVGAPPLHQPREQDRREEHVASGRGDVRHQRQLRGHPEPWPRCSGHAGGIGLTGYRLEMPPIRLLGVRAPLLRLARAVCMTCRTGSVVAFSCKGRGVCPSSSGRHMAETAAHLVEHVNPPVPAWQWVISVPKRLRGRQAARPLPGHRPRGTSGNER